MILHIDMDSYFASVEQQYNPALRRRAIGVGGKPGTRTVICAASREAKKFGVKSGMPPWQAKKLCPQIILVPGRYNLYQEVSRKIFAIFETITPFLEIFSIDEAFLDLKKIFLFPAVEIVSEIKAKIKKEMGEYITCSAGLSYNKLLAKLASDMDKPDGLTIISPNDWPKIKSKIKLDDFCGIGPRILKRLHALGIKTVEELGHADSAIFKKEFGIYGQTLIEMGQGIDRSKVISYWLSAEEKSMGHQYTLPRDLYVKDSFVFLFKLAEKVGERLRRKNLGGSRVSVFLRFSDFSNWRKQIKLHSCLNEGLEIFKIGRGLIESNISPLKKVRLVGISVSGFCQNSPRTGQEVLPLFPEEVRRQKLLSAIDKINSKFGSGRLKRASVLGAEIYENFPAYSSCNMYHET